ncbi:hypothetical protein GCM10008107_17300 [Psychrosphaera saromensis]|uniref:Tetratricopeptide repeat protein n=1 Tax=Psychrosphaera saromensis TaxID=716813 RepID=A0A2S7UTJ9_9GAMM|nr:hypothetical protein [Psychrosphaera saromensis]PQJ53065.1 hypothetical protein BTO11_04925 [Psychrosphaera saromensis]GHB68367.1 hypothetical protein GCM10008107_17300 [Psychrosphaera saromensis]GLQ15186.1 hypothetical protein GCM10007917_26410 [Psychrosphaera saromensis]
MREWENTMRQVKTAFNDKVFSTAISLNKKALSLANKAFDKNVSQDAHKAVASVMVSYFSLADSYIEIGSFDQAYKMYQKSFMFIQKLSNELHKNTELKIAIYKAISQLNNEWYSFKQRHEGNLLSTHRISPRDFKLNLGQLLKTHLATH